MSFFRPEAKAALWRWREVIAAAATAAVGAWWILGAGGFLAWLGWGLIAVAALMVVAGHQRARFRQGGGGPGLVEVDEGQITYMGPLAGGMMSVADLERLTFDPTARPPCWILEQPGAPPLFIPVNAAGAEQLFDAFAGLPGFRTERMLAELAGRASRPAVIWQRHGARPALQWLH